MKTTNRRPLYLEALEDRWVPATIRFDGSNLTISNLNIVAGKSTLTVVEKANGAFEVKDNGAAEGAYFVTGNLTIVGNNAADSVSITLDNKAGTLPGNLYVTAGNGNDTVALTTKASGGTIGGNVVVSLGTGADQVTIDPLTGTKAHLSIGGSLSVSTRPGSAQLTGGFGIAAHSYVEVNQQTSPTNSTFIGGNVNVTGATVTNLGAAVTSSPNGPLTIGGNVNIQPGAGGPAFADGNVTGSGTTQYNDYVALGVTAKVGGSVAITATTGSTYALVDSNIGGSLNANLGSGVTSGATGGNGAAGSVLDLNLNVGTGTGAPMTIGKDVNYSAGNGNNALLFDSNLIGTPPPPLVVGGSVNVNFGSGSNSVQFTDALSAAGDVFINGNFNYHAGNGFNNLGVASPFANVTAGSSIPFLASVQGSESFNVGNGSGATPAVPANIVDIGTAPGGPVSFNGGNGTDAFTLDNAASNGTTPQFYYVNALFGNGSNTFAISDTGGGGTTVSGSVIGGNGSNTFQQNQDAMIGSPFYLRNF